MADYLIHYNKNHSKANGQFVSGDGDGDGQVNDRASQKKQPSGATKPKGKSKSSKKYTGITVEDINRAVNTASFYTSTHNFVRKHFGKNAAWATTSAMLEVDNFIDRISR